MTTGTTIEIVRGDDRLLNLTFTDDNGNAIDLTGGTVFFTVKKQKNDLDADAIITKTVTSHTNAAGGLSQIDLTNSDTNITAQTYHFDLRYKDSSGNIVSPIDNGNFVIKERILTSTS